MPATSRHTLSDRRRSASALRGSPSKSMIVQPSAECRVWPRWKSPCTRWVASSVPSRAWNVRSAAARTTASSPTWAAAASSRASIVSATAAPEGASVTPWSSLRRAARAQIDELDHGSNALIESGSSTVFINGKPAHRLGDVVRHCGGTGKCIEGSGNVIVGDHSGDGTREQIEKIPQVGYEKQFRVISETTYTPIVNVLYEIRTPDGNMHTGTTDKNGLTKKVQSTQPGSAQITLHHKGQRSE